MKQYISMKKLCILSSFLMALCLLSCSSSEQDNPVIPEPQYGSISFGGNSGSWQDAPISRAGETGLETIATSFRVWGYKNTGGNHTDGFTDPQNVMNGYIVNWKQPKTGETGSWEYTGIENEELKTTQTIKFWDYSATSYRYFAFSPANEKVTTTLLSEDGSVTTNLTTATQTSFSIPFEYKEDATSSTTPYVSDLWLSDNQNFGEEKKYGACVKLTFAPIVAKLRIKFNYPENIKVAITGISFQTKAGEVPTAGNILINYPITGTGTAPTYSWTTTQTGIINLSIPYEEDTDSNHQTTERNKWYFVPPSGNTTNTGQGDYLITATIDGKKSTATIPAEYMQWKAGYQYTYIFKITEAGTVISFSNLLVEKWKESAPIQNTGGTGGW